MCDLSTVNDQDLYRIDVDYGQGWVKGIPFSPCPTSDPQKQLALLMKNSKVHRAQYVGINNDFRGVTVRREARA